MLRSQKSIEASQVGTTSPIKTGRRDLPPTQPAISLEPASSLPMTQTTDPQGPSPPPSPAHNINEQMSDVVPATAGLGRAKDGTVEPSEVRGGASAAQKTGGGAESGAASDREAEVTSVEDGSESGGGDEDDSDEGSGSPTEEESTPTVRKTPRVKRLKAASGAAIEASELQLSNRDWVNKNLTLTEQVGIVPLLCLYYHGTLVFRRLTFLIPSQELALENPPITEENLATAEEAAKRLRRSVEFYEVTESTSWELRQKSFSDAKSSAPKFSDKLTTAEIQKEERRVYGAVATSKVHFQGVEVPVKYIRKPRQGWGSRSLEARNFFRLLRTFQITKVRTLEGFLLHTNPWQTLNDTHFLPSAWTSESCY